MALSNNLTSFSAALAKLPQQKIAQVISACLLAYIAFIGANITWLVIPSTNHTISTNAAGNMKPIQRQSQAKNLDLSKLQSLNLFGQYQENTTTAVVEQITSAPETRLQLTLSGLVASDNVEAAAAIIENKGKQATYGIGDLIKDTRASLEQVLIDRVIIKQSGRLETLMLDGADYNQQGQSVSHKKASNNAKTRDSTNNGPQKRASESNASVVDQRTNKALSQNAQRLRADLQNNPGKITDHLRISPARKDGNTVGYRLSPGKNPEFFTLSGLKAGDVAIQMNGHDLLAPLEAAQALSALKTEQNISLLVEREGELIEILFSIN